jgi:hypothetical protein
MFHELTTKSNQAVWLQLVQLLQVPSRNKSKKIEIRIVECVWRDPSKAGDLNVACFLQRGWSSPLRIDSPLKQCGIGETIPARPVTCSWAAAMLME